MSSNSTPSADRPVLIIGATGKTGRRVAARLADRGVPFRAASRRGDVRFDWDDERTWPAAVCGAGSVYITYSPDLAVAAAPGHIEAFTRLAIDQGVRRLVLLSGRGEEAAQRCEQIVRGADATATIVRASWFLQNFSEGIFAADLRAGTLALPAGSVREPFIDVDDIADVVVAALTGSGHGGETYEVTGPRLLTFAEAVAAIGAAAGRELRYEQIPTATMLAGMRDAGVPEPVVGLTQFLFKTVLDGRNESVAGGVQRALGRPPRDIVDFARHAAATGVWAPPVRATGGDQ
jgi:uncharacterized protein YbjT (DUF2867 family)